MDNINQIILNHYLFKLQGLLREMANFIGFTAK